MQSGRRNGFKNRQSSCPEDADARDQTRSDVGAALQQLSANTLRHLQQMVDLMQSQ